MRQYRQFNQCNKKAAGMAAAALILAAAVSSKSAMAYFTTYAQAGGGAAITLGASQTIPDETVSNWTKHVTVKNTGEGDCYVRVRAIAGAQYQEALTYSDEAGLWTAGDDGYYYYSNVLAAGESSAELWIGIDNLGKEEDFNVIVVQEATPALYDAAGNPYADWSLVLDSDEGGAGA